ncbi:MAG: transcription-repair coupling factor [Gemmatimonadetes bacterium]|nr:transcription-repair coupling factor [Gemmatimonadota bacterium]
MRAAGIPEALSRRGARASVHPLPGAGSAALALALDDLAVGAPIVLVADTPERAEALHEDLRTLGAGGVRCYPQREALPYEDADPHIEIEAQRVDATGALLGGRCRILTTTARALAERAPIPVGPGTSLALTIRRGAAHPLAELGRRLEEMGFGRTHTVREVGDYAIRGGIVDLFPFGHPAPLRIELWGDEVESVRRFDALTQRSTEPLESVDVLPIALQGSETAGAVERRALLETLPPTALALILDPEGGVRARQRLWAEVRDARKRVGAGAEPAESLVLPPPEAEQRLATFRLLEFAAPEREPEQAPPAAIRLPVEPPPSIDRDMKRLVAEIGTARARGERLIVFCDNDGQVERLEEILTERGGAALAREVALAIGSLSGGFRVGVPGTLLVLTDHEVFRRRYRRHRVRLRGAATIESIAAIEPGDYVVHMEHGIGRYMGLERVEVRGETIETMEIRYADGEILRLPHYRLDLIERWSAAGTDARPPAVHKLGRRKWKQLRNRTVAAIEATAVELLQLYARRKMSPGRAFPAETAWQREMESAFLYDETPDQLSAWEAVRRDLEAPVPMDRLVCGDVGFGKTEVAIRAAFKAVQDGAQVAVLAPTTILADQHLATFRERLAGFPVHVEGLSRFRTPREQREVIAGLEAGTVDIVIGTHRLLSRDVGFRDLGLLIVDEEQRFGVRQKERLKEVRETVDVLTLTATPIPRTLHLALGGLRDLSTIRTPPRNRMPIITHVLSWDDGILEEALRREFDRGGQVFFVHDRVETIHAAASRAERLMPEARAAIAHGQMPERELEDVMHRFVRGEIDLLICTSIIENGLDVPSANTMIVHRAHNFGLAQLYQLRGRVGRSHRRAYCYLVVPSDVAPDAAERLRVLEHHTELGSGYEVALKDLELRGAGNLLGGEQSGFATAVGIETWQRLVESTLRRLRGESPDSAPRARVSVDGESFLPDDYVAGSPVKMHLYRRLSRLTKWEEVKAFRAELEDRFGRLPPPAARLLAAAELRILGAAIGADWIRASDDDARISFEATASPQLRLLTNALADRQLHVEVRRLEPLSLVLRRAGTEPLLPMLVEALGILAAPGRTDAKETRVPAAAGGV